MGLIQKAHGAVTGSGTLIPLSQPTTPNSLMVVAVAANDFSHGGNMSPTDDQPGFAGGSYARTVNGGFSPMRAEIWYLFPSINVGGANNVYFPSLAPGDDIEAWIYELTNPNTDNDDDSEHYSAPPATTTPPTGGGGTIFPSAPLSTPFSTGCDGEFLVQVVAVGGAGGVS